MVGVALLLIMTPIAIKVICRKKTNHNEGAQTDGNDDATGTTTGGVDKSTKYKRFQNQPESNGKSINNNL